MNQPTDCNEEQDRTMLMSLRKSYLEAVDAIERRLGIDPRTAEIRQQVRTSKRGYGESVVPAAEVRDE